jgi:hypothetical protein
MDQARDLIAEAWLAFDPDPPAPAVVATWRRIVAEGELVALVREIGGAGLLPAYREGLGICNLASARRQAAQLRREAGDAKGGTS